MAFEDIFASLNIALIVGILGVVLVVLGFMEVYKSKKARKTANIFGVILIGTMLVGAFVPGMEWLTNPIDLGEEPVPAAVGTPTGAPIVGCDVEDTTVTLSALDKYNSNPAGTTHRYSINGVPALTVSNAGTFTASPGDSLKILWGNETDGSYYGVVSTEVIPCAGTKTFTANLVQNGTLTIEVFNEEGNLIQSAAGTGGGENETLSPGDVVTLEAKLKGQYQRGFPYGGVMVAEFNGSGAASEIDDVIIDFGGSKVSVPTVHTTTFGTNSKRVAYSIPALESNEILIGSIVIDVDDTLAPGADAASGDINLTFYANDYFVNENTGGSFDGPSVSDEDDSVTFGEGPSFTINTD